MDLFFNIHPPKSGRAKATLLVVHGMMEHSARYQYFIDFLNFSDIAVATFDHPGHGKSVKDATELGFFALKQPVRFLLENTSKLAGILEKQYPNIPHFILGHSMGSFVTRCLLQIEPKRFDGTILMGTGDIMAGAHVGWLLLKILNYVAPRYRSTIVNRVFSWMNNRHFKNEPSDHGTNWLSIDTENRKKFQNDPLCGVDFTNNGFYTLLSLVVRATKKNWHKNIPKNFPVLFVSGAHDPIGDFGEGVQQTYDDMLNGGFRQVEIKLYPDMRHEILNEKDRKSVYEDIRDWILSFS